MLDVIEKAEVKRAALLSSQPEAKRNEKLLNALPAAAKQYRDQIPKGYKATQPKPDALEWLCASCWGILR